MPESAVSDKARVLIVDDDDGILQVSRMSLKRVKFRGKRLDILLAKSAKETLEILARESGVGVMLVDGEMETKSSGIDACQVIREELGNADLRIYLRTGKVEMDLAEVKAVETWDLEGHVPKGETSKDDLIAIVVAGVGGLLRQNRGLIRESSEPRAGLVYARKRLCSSRVCPDWGT